MDIHKHGIEIIKKYVSNCIINGIIEEIQSSIEQYPKHGIRRAELKFRTIHNLAKSDDFIYLAKTILGSIPEIVRVIYFDKTPDKNWLVTWHQDKTIAVDSKVDLDEWGPWSIKDNTNHVQPPTDVLNQMVTFRLHLDDADENNGCLAVIPGSHKMGVLNQKEMSEIIKTRSHFICRAKEGDLVIMKPLILHSSTKSINPSHRRVVHIEYCSYSLPGNLKWANQE